MGRLFQKLSEITDRLFSRGAIVDRPQLLGGTEPTKNVSSYKISYSFEGKRNFDAAVQGIVNSGWPTDKQTFDEVIYSNLSSLRGQARDLELNNDYIRRYMLLLNQAVVYRGIWPEPQFRTRAGDLDTKMNLELKKVFKKWAKPGNADVTAKLSFVDILRVSLWSLIRDGEAFLRIVEGERFGDFGFSLQVIDPILIDEQLNQTLSSGRTIVMGVELDEWSRPTAYYLKAKAGTPGVFVLAGTNYVRIPAEKMLHLMRAERAHQTRGVPWLRFKNLRMLGAYMESELIAARTASHKMAFLVNRGDGEELDSDEAGNIVTESYPGGIETLPFGYELQSWDPKHPNENFDAFIKTELRAIAAGLGVSYNSLALDLTSVNYS